MCNKKAAVRERRDRWWNWFKWTSWKFFNPVSRHEITEGQNSTRLKLLCSQCPPRHLLSSGSRGAEQFLFLFVFVFLFLFLWETQDFRESKRLPTSCCSDVTTNDINQYLCCLEDYLLTSASKDQAQLLITEVNEAKWLTFFSLQSIYLYLWIFQRGGHEGGFLPTCEK